MPEEKFTARPVLADPEQLRELVSAVSSQSSLVEDFLRDSEEKFAELTRRISSVEEIVKTPGALLSQYSSRDTSVANSVSEMRNKISETASGVAALRNELNKWENEINERFISLEKRPGFSQASELDSRLSEMERKIRALNSASDSFEKLIGEVSVRVDAACAGGALSSKVSELEKRVSSVPDISDLYRRIQAIELKASSLEISVKNINQRIILLGPHVIE